jgi:hypothetical protein
LQDDDFYVRLRVAEALGKIGSERAIDALVAMLQDENSNVRSYTAEALGKIGGERAIKALIPALQNQDSSVRSYTAEALGKIGNAKVLSQLWQLWLETSGEDLRNAIATIQSKCKYYNHEIYQSRPEIPTTPNRTLLILAANPTNRDRLRLDQEVREIEEGLRRSKHRDRITLQQRWAVRPADLRRALLDHAPHILHFCGHGEGETGIVLEDDNGKAKLVTTEAIANLFQLFADQGLECVILNACYSEIQASAIVQHIPYVIGMSNDILDTTARKFAIGFYDALGAGWSYEKAFEMGKSAIAIEGIPEADLPVLKQK